MINDNIILKLKVNANSYYSTSSFKFSTCFIKNNKIVSSVYNNTDKLHAEENAINNYILNSRNKDNRKS